MLVLLNYNTISLIVENASPICLPVEAVKDTKFNNAVATGWGYTDAGQRGIFVFFTTIFKVFIN